MYLKDIIREEDAYEKMGISLYNAALCLHGNSGNTACDYKRIPIEISKGGSIFYHITFLRNRDSSFVDGKEEWKDSCVGCFDWKCFAFVSVKGGNSAGVIVVYQKKRAGNS